jgi:hypothetical protein
MGVEALVRKILKEIGFREERFNLQWASAAEAPRFVQLITDYTQKIKELGPLGQAEGLKPEEVQARVAKALELVSSQKLRVGFGNVAKALRKESGNLTKQVIAEAVESKLTKTISEALS